MRHLGSWNGLEVFECSHKEYLTELRNNREFKSKYWVITDKDRRIYKHNEVWKPLVRDNMVVGMVSDANVVNNKLQPYQYSIVEEPSLEVSPTEVNPNESLDFDVDVYLMSEHSVDKFLRESKNW